MNTDIFVSKRFRKLQLGMLLFLPRNATVYPQIANAGDPEPFDRYCKTTGAVIFYQRCETHLSEYVEK